MGGRTTGTNGTINVCFARAKLVVDWTFAETEIASCVFVRGLQAQAALWLRASNCLFIATSAIQLQCWADGQHVKFYILGG